MQMMFKTAIAAACMLASGMVFGQTCASPSSWTPDVAGAPPQSGTTCGAADAVSLYCGLLDSASKPDVIYQITLAAVGPNRTASSIIVGGGAAGFTPNAFLYSDACAQADACAETGDPLLPLPLTGVAAGTYFLAVSATSVDGPNACGTYTLTTQGTFPVALQNFSVD